ncbi:putative lipase atg15 [Coelomomyces lativittatus]|nr:putative lipase atg15 [Coelomomyces lativittatus]
MFSCCCAHVDFTWKPICNCFQSGHFCNQTCLQENSIYDASYYQASLDLYHAIWQAYPASMQWFTGHSLGGALAGLLAVTYVRPAVTFQAPGEKRYAHTLGLPMNQFPALPVYHVGVDVDPIYLGHCQGVTSPCYLAGYAIETFCHLGHTCRLKVKQNLRLQEDIKYHRIGQVVELLQELKNSQNLTDPTSSLFNSSLIQCEINHGCHDCRSWKYY